MKTTSLLLAIAVVAIAIGLKTLASGLADQDDALIFLSEVPQGSRDWKLIAVSRLTTSIRIGSALRSRVRRIQIRMVRQHFHTATMVQQLLSLLRVVQ